MLPLKVLFDIVIVVLLIDAPAPSTVPPWPPAPPANPLTPPNGKAPALPPVPPLPPGPPMPVLFAMVVPEICTLASGTETSTPAPLTVPPAPPCRRCLHNSISDSQTGTALVTGTPGAGRGRIVAHGTAADADRCRCIGVVDHEDAAATGAAPSLADVARTHADAVELVRKADAVAARSARELVKVDVAAAHGERMIRARGRIFEEDSPAADGSALFIGPGRAADFDVVRDAALGDGRIRPVRINAGPTHFRATFQAVVVDGGARDGQGTTIIVDTAAQARPAKIRGDEVVIDRAAGDRERAARNVDRPAGRVRAVARAPHAVLVDRAVRDRYRRPDGVNGTAVRALHTVVANAALATSSVRVTFWSVSGLALSRMPPPAAMLDAIAPLFWVKPASMVKFSISTGAAAAPASSSKTRDWLCALTIGAVAPGQ